jgi:hypothetical protein
MLDSLVLLSEDIYISLNIGNEDIDAVSSQVTHHFPQSRSHCALLCMYLLIPTV